MGALNLVDEFIFKSLIAIKSEKETAHQHKHTHTDQLHMDENVDSRDGFP